MDLTEEREVQCNDWSGFAPDARSGAVLFAPVGHEGVKFGSDMPFLTTMSTLFGTEPKAFRSSAARSENRGSSVELW